MLVYHIKVTAGIHHSSQQHSVCLFMSWRDFSALVSVSNVLDSEKSNYLFTRGGWKFKKCLRSSTKRLGHGILQTMPLASYRHAKASYSAAEMLNVPSSPGTLNFSCLWKSSRISISLFQDVAEHWAAECTKFSQDIELLVIINDLYNAHSHYSRQFETNFKIDSSDSLVTNLLGSGAHCFLDCSLVTWSKCPAGFSILNWKVWIFLNALSICGNWRSIVCSNFPKVLVLDIVLKRLPYPLHSLPV